MSATHPVSDLPLAVAIGIPARDEVDRIEACVGSVLDAVARLGVPAAVVIAADQCRDATAAVARAALSRAGAAVPTSVLRVDHGCVGLARQAACAHAVSLLDRPLADIWLATTDADTVVPASWLVDQWRWVAQGADGVAGLVELDPADPLVPQVRERYLALVGRDGTGPGHPHVHGANLGLRATFWDAVGGFPPALAAEDHQMWERARRAGARLAGADDVVVRTSARLDGRTPTGFAQLLVSLGDSA